MFASLNRVVREGLIKKHTCEQIQRRWEREPFLFLEEESFKQREYPVQRLCGRNVQSGWIKDTKGRWGFKKKKDLGNKGGTGHIARDTIVGTLAFTLREMGATGQFWAEEGHDGTQAVANQSPVAAVWRSRRRQGQKQGRESVAVI